MKQYFAVLLALALLLSLAACAEPTETTGAGGNTTAGATQSTQASQSGTGTGILDPTLGPDVSLEDIFDSTNGTIWGKQDEATKQKLIQEGKAEGYDISFAVDGTMTIVDGATGETMIQHPDGTWTIKDENGGTGQLGGNWPDNEFTRLLPRPDMEVGTASTTDTEFAVLFQNATLDQMKDYAEKVKAMGFTVNPELTDQEVSGMQIYTYTASNADGYTVTVTCAMGVCSVMLEKP